MKNPPKDWKRIFALEESTDEFYYNGVGMAPLTAITGQIRYWNGNHCWRPTAISPSRASGGSGLVAQRSRSRTSCPWVVRRTRDHRGFLRRIRKAFADVLRRS